MSFLLSKNLMQQIVSSLLVAVLLISEMSALFTLVPPQIAEAAQTNIDTGVDANAPSHLHAGSQMVFVSDQVGYRFYRDNGGSCVYSKTTDGGGVWDTAVTVDAQTDCISIVVWYDRWTPGDSGNFIHIATLDTTNRGFIYYNRLDTTSDTLLMGSGPVNTGSASGQGGSMSLGANFHAMTKATNGTLYVTVSDAGSPSADSYVLRCSTTCSTGSNWTEAGTTPLDSADDYNLLVPLAGGNVMVINRDISADDIRTKIWNGTSWSGTWTTVDANASDNTTYDVGMSVAVSSTTGRVYLAYIADYATLGTATDIRTAVYNGTSWTSTTDVISNTTNRAVTNVSIGLNAANDNVYVLYSARTTPGTAGTGNIYWKSSANGMSSWSTESTAVNSSAGDLYGVDLNMHSDYRLYASWYVGGTIVGDTIMNDYPGIHVGVRGTQTTNITASTSAASVGAAFVFTNNYKTIPINSITLTESGTIHGADDINNVRLRYEYDTTAPYDCASETRAGTESFYGPADTDGFSGDDGTSTLTPTSAPVASSTQAVCMYLEMDVLDSAANGATIEISIEDPETEVIVGIGVAGPTSAQALPGTTTVLNDNIRQMHYHFRNDNGNETTATSKTGGTQDTPISDLARFDPLRIRFGLSNEGGASSPSMQFRLEYSDTTGTCAAATNWVDIGASGGSFDMYDSANLTNGANTTNISDAIGGVTNENTTLLSPNGGIRDTSSQTGGLVLTTSNYVELEYSIVATNDATGGTTYCFRITDAGTPLAAYDVYPQTTIEADIDVSSLGTQVASIDIPTTGAHLGGQFVIREKSISHNVTSITLSEDGTVDASTGVSNITIRYDLDTSAPYDCASETYSAGDTLFGSVPGGFSGPDGTVTITGSASVTVTATMCAYVVVNVTSASRNAETLSVYIDSPSSDVVVSGGGVVGPSTLVDLSGVTSLDGPILTQIHYHFRNDNGSETAATSATGGVQDVPLENVSQTTPFRLRLEVSNEGPAPSVSRPYRIEYGAKSVTCDAIASWIDVGAPGGAFDMYDSTHLTEGSNTTDVAEVDGGVADENTTFLTPNSAVKDTSSVVASTTLSETQFLVMEFSMIQTEDAAYDAEYCFRVSHNGIALDAYSAYPEISTSPERDFEIQRGTITMTTVSTTLTAGVDYVAPISASRAFIRITNSHHTGAGSNGGANTQNSNDVTAYIQDPENIMSSITIARPATFAGNTRVSWEIVEFIGAAGSDNEIIVRGQGAVTYVNTSTTVNSPTVSGVQDASDVVVFITGQANPDTAAADYNTGQSTSNWDSVNNYATFTRGESNADAVQVSYAVVEFVGRNWKIQRVAHTYTAAGITETEAITSVNSLSRAFLHTQKRIGASLDGVDEFGHEVWLSSVGFVSFFLESGATTPSSQTSVAWVIENTQTTTGMMDVTRSNGSTNGGGNNLTINVSIGKTLSDTTNASIFLTTRAAGTGTNHPRAIAGVTISSATQYQLWRSNTVSNLTYRTAVVEWPTASLELRQNYYRLYVDNGALTPTDPWPSGASDLGENTAMTIDNDPLGVGERIRIRMSLRALNSTFPELSRSFKLQYAPRTSTCSAVTEGTWTNVGAIGSGAAWRGYDVTGLTDGTQLSGNPFTPGDLLLSVSDVAGTFEEENNSADNLYAVTENSDIEYDWIVEQNGATSDTVFCFRMIDSSDTALAVYSNHPQIRTAKFTPRSQNWRWYDDASNVTPSSALASENIAPVDIPNSGPLKLRVTVKDIKNTVGTNTRFKLQYSEYADFRTVFDVVSTTTCTANSIWCYYNGAGNDNAVIAASVLSDSDACSGGVGNGCGTHNESAQYRTGFTHPAGAATEYEFTIMPSGPRVNLVYYFRLYDTLENVPVVTNTGESYPSAMTEGAKLTFTVSGVPAATSVEGELTDITTTPTSIPFGNLTFYSEAVAAQRLSVSTNATEGYQVLVYTPLDPTNGDGSTIGGVLGTNPSPLSWNSGCALVAAGCFGYHTGDGTLSGGSTRFSPIDTYARFETVPHEVAFSSQPSVNETTDVVFKVLVRETQGAGQYETNVVYIAMPVF